MIVYFLVYADEYMINQKVPINALISLKVTKKSLILKIP